MSTPRIRVYEGDLNTLSRGKITIAGFSRKSELVVEFHIHDTYGKTHVSTLSLHQARETLRHLTGAVAALEISARHDGWSRNSAPCGGAAELSTDEQAG